MDRDFAPTARDLDPYATPEWTTAGPVCGFCTFWTTHQESGKRHRIDVRHASIAQVRLCGEVRRQSDEEARQEMEAENAWLRYAEGGWDTTGEYAWDSLRERW